MNITKQSAIQIENAPNLGFEDLYKFTEKMGRICYRSEDKITDDSHVKFFDGLVKRGHLSVLEHSYVILEIDKKIYSKFKNLHTKLKYFNITDRKNSVIMSGNIRAFYENKNTLPEELNGFLHKNISDKLFDKKPTSKKIVFKELYHLSTQEKKIHKRITFKIKTSISNMVYFIRHRKSSITVESTRYVDYKEINFIDPGFDKMESYQKEAMLGAFQTAELYYLELREKGVSKQIAREVLPKAQETNFYITNSVKDWLFVFSLRRGKGAHPSIIDLLGDWQKMIFGE